MPWIIEWSSVMARSQHRGLRHTGTEVCMTAMMQLASLKVEVLEQLEAKEKLVGGKKKKDRCVCRSALASFPFAKRAAAISHIASLPSSPFPFPASATA